MAPLIPVAAALAQFAPQIVRWVSGSEKAEQAAQVVVDIAQQVTGAETPDAAVAAMRADPGAAMAFRQAVLERETELDKAFLADVQDARRRDDKIRDSGAYNWRADVLAVTAFAAIVGLTYMVWTAPDLNEYVKGIITFLMGRFAGYVDNIYMFEFGSTRTSKVKDATIERLSGGK